MSERGIQIVRLVLGVLFSPLIGLLAGLVVLHFRHPGGFGWLDGPVSRLETSKIYLLIFAIRAYPGMIVLGIPTHLCFQKLKWRSAWQYCLAGLVGGIATIAIANNIMSLHRPRGFPHRVRLFPFGVLHPGVVGITIGLAFWMITVWRRHNKSLHTINESVPEQVRQSGDRPTT